MFIFGDPSAKFIIYCSNTPSLPPMPTLNTNKGQSGIEDIQLHAETLPISQIVDTNGNHWRKIFNISAKLTHKAIDKHQSESWQQYRDTALFKARSRTLLVCSKTIKFEVLNQSKAKWQIVMGKNHYLPVIETARQHGMSFDVIDGEGKILFAQLNGEQSIILSPYFDYRQFPNKLIDCIISYLEKTS